MVVHKCDICKSEMGVWFTFKIDIDAQNDRTNVSQYLDKTGTMELCPTCWDSMLQNMKQTCVTFVNNIRKDCTKWD